MKPILFTIVIFLTFPAFAEDLAGFYPALGEFIPHLGTSADVGVCKPLDLGDFSHPDNPFHTSITLTKGIAQPLQMIQFEDTGGASRLKVKLGNEYDVAFAEVLTSIPTVGTVRALATFEAASHAKISTAKAFIEIYRKLLTL